MPGIAEIRSNDRERHGVTRAYVPTRSELKNLFRSLEGSRHKSRNNLIMCLSFYSGLRCSEIAALRLSDLFLADGSQKGETEILGKGGRSRKIYLNSKPLQLALEEFKNDKCNFKDLFENRSRYVVLNQSKKPMNALGMCKLMKWIFKGANLARCSSHSGVRWFISQVIYKTGNIGLAKKYAGHSDIRTTLIYFEDNPQLLRDVAANIYK